MIDLYYVLEVRDKLTCAKEEVEGSNQFSSVNKFEVEIRARELNDALSGGWLIRFSESFCLT